MKTIITIGRQAGSGGREIGEKLAKEFGIKYYDRELLTRAAKDSGFCEEVFEHHDERPTSSFLYNLVMDTYSFGYNSASFVDMPISHKVFLAQFDTIKKVAQEGPCVIVGRCADYALADQENLLRIFLHGNMKDRIQRISEKYSLSPDKAKEMIKKYDKQRASYYNYYASGKWGHCDTYDLSINTSILGIDGTIEMIKKYVEAMENK